MRDGRITTRLETGADDDTGKMRLSFFHDDLRVRLTCSEDGTVLKTLRTFFAKQRIPAEFLYKVGPAADVIASAADV